MKQYDYLIVGAGLYGAVLARELMDAGKKVLVLDRRNHIAGNVFTKKEHDIHVHQYGAHIFHTNDDEVWDYVHRFADFNRFTNSPVAIYKGKAYSMPFNMHTFSKMWDISTPQEAKAIIEEQRKEIDHEPQNLEEQAISLVGRDIYEALVKGYTEKQWGRECKDLPSFIIKRLPVRFTYDNNYFNAKHQGIPMGGYTAMVEKMLDGADILLETDYLKNKDHFDGLAENIVYTGPIDEYFDYKHGNLEYRSLDFDTKVLDTDNFQGNAAVNYTDAEIPYTRIIEHKHFEDLGSDKTIVTYEYPADWTLGKEAYYPINDERNNELYKKYKEEADKEHVIFGGRLGEYKYYDMDQVIRSALDKAKELV